MKDPLINEVIEKLADLRHNRFNIKYLRGCIWDRCRSKLTLCTPLRVDTTKRSWIYHYSR